MRRSVRLDRAILPYPLGAVLVLAGLARKGDEGCGGREGEGGMTEEDLEEIAARLEAGPTTKGVTASPWAVQLQKDAYALLAEVYRARGWVRHRSSCE